jgi:hypothetical protein
MKRTMKRKGRRRRGRRRRRRRKRRRGIRERERPGARLFHSFSLHNSIFPFGADTHTLLTNMHSFPKKPERMAQWRRVLFFFFFSCSSSSLFFFSLPLFLLLLYHLPFVTTRVYNLSCVSPVSFSLTLFCFLF